MIGVDFAGPLNVNMPGSARRKPSILIITCAHTRAVSLQPCIDQIADSFIRGYSKLLYTRNARPKIIRSDNAQAFKSSEDILRIMEATHGAKWRFNPPKAPWWGGFYERLIGMIKGKLAYCFNRRKFVSYDDFVVAVAYLEYLLNNRPLHITENPETGERLAIRPAMFINPGHEDNFKKNLANIIQPLAEDSMTAKQMGQKVIQQRNFFAQLQFILATEYVDKLRTWHTNEMFNHDKSKEPKIKIGDLVLVKPDTKFKENSPMQKTKWQMAVVTEVTKTPAGRTKTIDVEIKTEDGRKVKRKGYPPQAFAPLELKPEEGQSKLDTLHDLMHKPVSAEVFPT